MRSPAYRTILVTLGAEAEKTVNASGSIIRVLNATDAFQLSFGDDTFFETEAGLGYEPFYGMTEADGVTPQTFRTLRFRNPTGSAMDIRVQIGTGNIVDGRVVFGGTAVPVEPIEFDGPQPVSFDGAQPVAFDGAQPVSFDGPQPVENAPGGRLDVSAVSASVERGAFTVASNNYQRISADGARRAVTIENRGVGRVAISEGAGGAVSTSHSISLGPGERRRLEVSGLLQVSNSNAFSVPVVYLEEFY